MKTLNKLKTDAKVIIHDLRDMNASLLDAVTEYQQIIFEQKEEIANLKDVIKAKEFEIYVLSSKE